MAFTPMSLLNGDLLGGDLAVDLGTANTLVYARGRGIMLNEPSVVAVDTTTRAVVAVGSEAKRMIGRTPGHIKAVRPLQDGVIADYDTTAEMLRYFVRKVVGRRAFAGPRVVICVPSGITSVEQRAVSESAYAAGARRVHIISEPMAAAIGAGLPVSQAAGSMVVDIGGGTTEVAIIALAGIVASTSLRVAGDALDRAIVDHIRTEFQMLIGERTAEELKISIGSAFPIASGPSRAQIRGRDMATGLPRNVAVSADELRVAMNGPINRIVAAVRATLDRCPPELAGDLVSRGIVLTGGGALLRGLDARLQHELGIPVLVAERPLDSVVLGTATVVEQFESLHKVVVDGHRR